MSVVVVRALLLATACTFVAGAQAPPLSGAPTAPFLVTAGQGEARVAPDRASVMISVQTRALTAAEAGAENAQRTRAVQNALLKLGLPPAQLTTEGYGVQPEMVYQGNGVAPRVTGYVVTNYVRAESHQPAQVGAILDAALEAGANMINSLSFYAASIDVPRREAIALAVASARADADAMAHAAGGSLGALLEMSTQGPNYFPRYESNIRIRGAATAAMAEPTPVTPGQQTVSVHVNAKWAFVPR